jgi:predicted ATP-grasp superfamily ATP-dependent carboligase
MVKPRTQVLFPSRSKGLKVTSDTELAEGFRRIGAMTHKPLLEQYDHDASIPIVQEFFADAAEGIYNLSGFVSQSGQLSGLRAGVKVLQRPRRIGIGLCFEEAAIDETTADAIKRLVTKAGFVGVFEAEFIRTSHGNLLIDFNPRFYNQMAFDIDRGLPLAELAYYEAIGDDARVHSLIAQSVGKNSNPARVYSHRFLLEVTLGLQGLSGALSKNEVKHWRNWIREHRGRTTDAVFDVSDLAPSILDTVQHLYGYARHPRATIRNLLLNR